MMVGNDIKYDTRVYKTALALADGGLEVTVLAFSPTGHRLDTRFGPIRIVRIPVPFRLRKKHQERTAKRQAKRLIPRPPSRRDKRINELQYRLRRDEAKELGGRALYARERVAWMRNTAWLQWGKVLQKAAPREERWRAQFHDWVQEQTRLTSWRRDLPEIDDYELAYAPFIDAEDWDILHAHDVHHVGTAARSVVRRRAQGRSAQWIYDAHEYVSGLSLSPPRSARVRAAWVDLESEYIHRADAVITVTEPLAEQLRVQYSLPETPTVVMNSPLLTEDEHVDGEDVRTLCGLPRETPLVVYSGGVTSARGVQTVVDALPALPGVHLAVVCVPHSRTTRVRDLRERAVSCGVADRLHLLEPVPPARVSSFLRTADIGVAPFLHFGSHEFALPNKLFEYLRAGLPLVVSDCRAVAQFVNETGVGAVFAAEDPASCAEALRDVLRRRTALHHRIAEDDRLLEPYSWNRQAASLRALYRRMLGDDSAVLEPSEETSIQGLQEEPPWRDDRPSMLAIGPTNMAGQGWAWAKSLEREMPGLATHVITIDRGAGLTFPANVTVSPGTYRQDAAWSAQLELDAMDRWTHVLLESGKSLFGTRHGVNFDGDAKLLLARGIRVGLVMHGSEIRNPERNAEATPWSPFRDRNDPLTSQLQRQVKRLSTKVAAFAADGLGPVFMSTPDLLPEVSGSIWLPVVVDTDRWRPSSPTALRDRPIVVHAPSRAALKGTAEIDNLLTRLHERGVLEYRRLENVNPDYMTRVIGDADIVLDQFALGSYGVLACEAMAAEKVVLGHVLPEVRAASANAAGMELPLVEATPDIVEEVIFDLLRDRDTMRETARAGRRYVKSLHSGRYSAEVLATHLHLQGANTTSVRHTDRPNTSHPALRYSLPPAGGSSGPLAEVPPAKMVSATTGDTAPVYQIISTGSDDPQLVDG